VTAAITAVRDDTVPSVSVAEVVLVAFGDDDLTRYRELLDRG